MIIEKNAISKSFSNAAGSYNFWAKPQKEIARRFVELLPKDSKMDDILDLGCGTGYVIERLLEVNPSSKILGVDIAPGMIDFCLKRWNNSKDVRFCNDDISCFKTGVEYDLILSSCAFQWIDDLVSVIKSLALSLRKDGIFAVAVPIKGSFFELQESYESVFQYTMSGLEYKTKEYYTDITKEAGIRIRSEKIETVVGYFNGLDVFKYFKKIGATFQYSRNYFPLSIKDIHRLLQEYENKFAAQNGLLPVTHEILYMICADD